MNLAMAIRFQLRHAVPGQLRALMLRIWSDDWIWSAGVQAVGSGMSLIISVVAARLLGVTGFGVYVLVHAGVVLLSALQYQLVAGPMAVAAGHRTRSPAYFGAVARAALWVAVLIGAAVALYSAALVEGSEHSGVALPIAAGIFAVGFVAQDSAKRLAFATNRPRVAFGCECARHGLFALALAAVWLARGVDVPVLLASSGLTAIAAALPIYAGALRVRSRAGLRRAVRDHHLLLGRWLVLVVFVSAAHEQLATILAGSWLGEDAAAGLRAAQILLGPLLVLMTSIENIVPRRAAQRLREGGEATLAAYLMRILLVLEVPVVAACVGIGSYSADILMLLLGEDFAGFAAVTAIIAMGPPLTLAREFGVIYLRATRRTGGVLTAFAASAVATLLAAYPLIAAYGVRGAACVILLGHAVSTAVILALAVRAMQRAHGRPA